MARRDQSLGPRPSTRARALLAAGLVLGLGAGATLAAWNDSEHSVASFEAGEFGIVGSIDGSTFTDHPQHAPAQLGFSPSVDGLLPGATLYALFSVRTTAGSVPGTVQLLASPANGAGLGQWLEYSARIVTTPACDPATFAAGIATGLPQGQPLTQSAAGTQTLGADGADQVNYCFRVTLPQGTSNAAQGASLDASWTFTAQAG